MLYSFLYISCTFLSIINICYIYIQEYNTNQGWVKRCDMYAAQSFMLLHSSGIIHMHIFWIFWCHRTCQVGSIPRGTLTHKLRMTPPLPSMRWSCEVMRQINYIISPIQLQKTNGHQIRQGTDLPWEALKPRRLLITFLMWVHVAMIKLQN